ncbi:enoyl-CoA hydratase/isomerase family protein [Stutzerimonas tarimensis]|uniref:3-hydroxyisobutyryl-CoA hydrolase n=1 Tax=Stutzerimonas tarimensis TaxID=1507735 RepID=A0ABV7T9I7_9GAMM
MNVIFEERLGHHGARLGIATLDSEKTLNALNLPMAEMLSQRFEQWAQDPSITCVMLRGNGTKAFCAGGEVRSLSEACRSHPGEVPTLAAHFFEREYRLVHQLRHFPKPLLTWGHGYVLGGGMGLLQSGSIRVVTPSSRLAMPEISIGLYPDVGATWFLSRLPGKLGLFLGLTATQVNARDALDLSLADRLLRDDQQPELIEGLLQLNWSQQPELQLNSLLRMLEESARAQAPEPQMLPRRARIDELLDVADLPGAWHALVALRDDPDALLARAAQNLASGSPLTAHLIWEQLQRGRYLSLTEALMLEYSLSINCCRHPEFAEGVRARLIDRDNQPAWHWPDVDSVPGAVVQAHFEPAWAGPHPMADLSAQLR